MSALWELAKTMLAVAILGGIAWAAYTVWESPSPGANENSPGASFNCRRAIADHTIGYTCMNSDSCSMSDGEIAALKRLEANINAYCD